MNNNIKQLSNDELISTNGGWNLIEYVAMGIGYVVGSIEEANENAPDYVDSALFGPNARPTI